ncbi:MAG: hypothetical protein H7338_00155 [Candidatus Sericytochromatia bacterium]|nr:hypothetical protein [Candidatus Sericytochromatia bacterium]
MIRLPDGAPARMQRWQTERDQLAVQLADRQLTLAGRWRLTWLLGRLNQPQEAMAVLMAGLAGWGRDWPEAHAALIGWRVRHGQFGLALAQARQSVIACPKSAGLWYLLAEQLVQSGDLGAAVSALRRCLLWRALETGPERWCPDLEWQPEVLLARIWLATDDPRRALSLLGAALGRDSLQADWTVLAAVAAVRMDRIGLAEALLKPLEHGVAPSDRQAFVAGVDDRLAVHAVRTDVRARLLQAFSG